MSHDADTDESSDLILSFRSLRQSLGWMGLALPVVLVIGSILFDHKIERSISHFYYSHMSDVYIGILCAIGVFLIAYRGYGRRDGEWLSDRWVSRIAGVSAIGVALVPTYATSELAPPCKIVQCMTGHDLAFRLHQVFSSVFFISLALFCLVLFTRSSAVYGPVTRAKYRRNQVFRWCGWVLIASMVALISYQFMPAHWRAAADDASYQFWLESIGIWAFGISWLVKGHAVHFLEE